MSYSKMAPLAKPAISLVESGLKERLLTAPLSLPTEWPPRDHFITLEMIDEFET